ncbi:hypothetical protein [Nocardia cyriacigeorgica]|uniref:hypothetical protein n=1 Tax=Nocardia cyriacigeorgica TaxID=135487 RepID=UPI0014860F13|nr:hypothetical protein [Nocardia cyriacigeorgica]
MSARVYELRDGAVIPEWDFDHVARAFGFNSARHMEDVLAGRAPTLLDRPKPVRR